MRHLAHVSAALLLVAVAAGCAPQNTAGLETGQQQTAADKARHERASRNTIDAMTFQQYSVNGPVF